jgi:hypothetical protein
MTRYAVLIIVILSLFPIVVSKPCSLAILSIFHVAILREPPIASRRPKNLNHRKTMKNILEYSLG